MPDSVEVLRGLPLRSIVAFAARCALRVRPLYRTEDVEHAKAVDRAIRYAVDFARGAITDVVNTAIADGASRAADATASGASGASGAAAAAGAAAVAAGRAVVAAAAAGRAADAADFAAAAAAAVVADFGAANDLEQLLALSGKQDQGIPELGDPVDVSEAGPLGALWPQGLPPGWPTGEDATAEVQDEAAVALTQQIADSEPAPLVSVYFDDCGFTDEEKLLFLKYLAETYRDLGGVGLKLVEGRTLVPEREVVS